jgi:2-polyprenyl-3-methyl-5-hydroxy-6-metoxy-1,4-benzoquinol methylase
MQKDYLDREKYVKRGAYHLDAYANNPLRRKDVDAILEWFETLEPNTESRIVELGAGDGLYVNLLFKDGYTNTIGFDACEVATRLAADRQIPVYYGYAHQFGFTWEKWDVCVMFDAFEHFTNPEEVVEHLGKKVKSSIYIVNPQWESENHYRLYELKDILELFSEWELGDYKEYYTHSGRKQELIQLLRKD